MNLTLTRECQSHEATTGHLSIDGVPFCFTLERPAAHFGDPHPCIPAGEYPVVLCHSPHFGRLMPLLVGVPGRTGIEIHWGNFVHDFEGCIGVGATRGETPGGNPTIWNSRATFDRLFDQISAAIGAAHTGKPSAQRGSEPAYSGVCLITIRDPKPADQSAIAQQFASTEFAQRTNEREVDAPELNRKKDASSLSF